MKTAKGTLLEILKNNNGQIDLRELEVLLVDARVLGFGVEPIDVVAGAERDGWVVYDPKSMKIVLVK